MSRKLINLNNYVVGDLISNGSYGNVYEAVDKATNQEFVVKFNRHSTMNSREAQILLCLQFLKFDNFPKV